MSGLQTKAKSNEKLKALQKIFVKSCNLNQTILDQMDVFGGSA